MVVKMFVEVTFGHFINRDFVNVCVREFSRNMLKINEAHDFMGFALKCNHGLL